MIGSDKLTDPVAENAKRVRNTVPGMASWGGEGPPDTTCRECSQWHKPKDEWKRWSIEGGLKPQRCDKACRMMRNPHLPAVSGHQASCKFFERNPEPPPVHRPHR